MSLRISARSTLFAFQSKFKIDWFSVFFLLFYKLNKNYLVANFHGRNEQFLMLNNSQEKK
jgi:hypothetical protein